MNHQKYMRVPPKFSELKKKAENIEDEREQLGFWIKEKSDYIQETSWKMKKVDVLSDNNSFITETLKRRENVYKNTGEDHNLRSIKAEIDRLKEVVENKKGKKLDKVDLWINKNIPNSPNKGIYKKVFEFILQHPAPRDITYISLVNDIRVNIDPKISDESLRKKIPNFINDLPL